MFPREREVVQPILADAAPAALGAGADEELEEVLDRVGALADVVRLPAKRVVQVGPNGRPAV